ncbi:MAG: acyl carrier protein [Alphaproteobacteria bacterium]|nr:acyl carrier protein [Alphaproteobacteria bacterium]MBV9553467.1 acyl carrier protein [Alphaproteobacteria bacterium]
MSVGTEIRTLFAEVAKEQNKTLAPLTDELGLLETGLDSLCFAIIVARLEDRFGLDPFSADDEIDFPVTVGDFIRLYENAAAPPAAA